MHNCGKASDSLVDLLFGELPAGRRGELLREMGSCRVCRLTYAEAEDVLSTFDRVAAAATPNADTWVPYNHRLRLRLRGGLGKFEDPAHRVLSWKEAASMSFLAACLSVLLLSIPVWWSLPTRNQRPPNSASVNSDDLRLEDAPLTRAAASPVLPSEPAKLRPAIEKRLGVLSRKVSIVKEAHEEGSSLSSDTVRKPDIALDSVYDRSLDEEIARHIEKGQALLLSFKNARAVSQETALELGFERHLAGALLMPNRLLRRQAASQGDIAAEELLNQFEPILVDIAHLQERSTENEVGPIRERMEGALMLTRIRLYLLKLPNDAS